MKNVTKINHNVEEYIVRTDHLSYWTVLLFPIIGWASNTYSGDSEFFYRLIIAGVLLGILSIFDIWVPEDYLHIIKHTRSILLTISLALMIGVMYVFYAEHKNVRSDHVAF